MISLSVIFFLSKWFEDIVIRVFPSTGDMVNFGEDVIILWFCVWCGIWVDDWDYVVMILCIWPVCWNRFGILLNLLCSHYVLKELILCIGFRLFAHWLIISSEYRWSWKLIQFRVWNISLYKCVIKTLSYQVDVIALFEDYICCASYSNLLLEW